MVTISNISDEDMKRPPIKTFDDGTDIRFKLGSGLKDGTRDFYQTAYSRNKKAICLNDQEILECFKRLAIPNDVDILVPDIYKIFKHDMSKMKELLGFDISMLSTDIQNKEIMINMLDTDVMVNMPKLNKDEIIGKLLIQDSKFINGVSSYAKIKMDSIINNTNIKSIDCMIEKEEIGLGQINQSNIIDKLFGELKFCHKKLLYYLYTVFLSEDIYLINGIEPTRYGRRLKMAGILYVLKENCEPKDAAKQFHNQYDKDIKEKLKIIDKYDDVYLTWDRIDNGQRLKK